jgi:hypothetical protein
LGVEVGTSGEEEEGLLPVSCFEGLEQMKIADTVHLSDLELIRPADIEIVFVTNVYGR